MSIVRHPNAGPRVLVKVVQATDTWHIAAAANFQNQIDQIKLKLARYIRPQAVRATAVNMGVQFRKPAQAESAYAVLDAIYGTEVNEDEFNALFLALFSSSPRNSIANNYTEVNTPLVSNLFQDENPDREYIFETLFRLHQVTQNSAQKAEQLLERDAQLAYLFQRFRKDDKPGYRAVLAVLAACGMAKTDIYSKSTELTDQMMLEFMRKTHDFTGAKPEVFIKYYQLAFTSIALDAIRGDDIEQMLQHMKTTIERANFSNLYLKLRALANTDSWLQANE